MKRPPTFWTRDRDRELALAWAAGGAEAAAQALGRTTGACARRARELELPDPAAGCVTVCELARALGYSGAKVISAARALGLVIAARPLRHHSRGSARRQPRTAITPEQQRAITDALAAGGKFYDALSRQSEAGRWGVGRKPPSCLGRCGTDRPHAAGGYCKPCYAALHRAGRKPPPLPAVASARSLRRLDAPLARSAFDGNRVDGAPPPEVARRLARASIERAAVADEFADAQGKGREWLGHDGHSVIHRGGRAA